MLLLLINAADVKCNQKLKNTLIIDFYQCQMVLKGLVFGLSLSVAKLTIKSSLLSQENWEIISAKLYKVWKEIIWKEQWEM